MGKYKIRVKVELLECDGDKEHGVIKEDDGCFAMTITEQDAMNIDNCENALLRTAHSTIRDAISKHLSEVSKKKRLKKPNQEK
jgi:hypothetical protein